MLVHKGGDCTQYAGKVLLANITYHNCIIQLQDSEKYLPKAIFYYYDEKDPYYFPIAYDSVAYWLTADQYNAIFEFAASRSLESVRFSSSLVTINRETGGYISSYSNWGLSTNLDIKPEVAAFGKAIHSTYLNGTYRAMSGTSMSTPFVTGSYALMLEQFRKSNPNKNISTTDLRGLLMNYAVDLHYSVQDGTQTVPLQGAGLIQVDRAINGSSRVYPPKIPLGYVGSNTTQSITISFNITNSNHDAKNYEITFRQSKTVNVTDSSAPSIMDSFSDIQYLGGGNTAIGKNISVQVSSGETKNIKAIIYPNSTLNMTDLYFFSGMIYLQPKSVSGTIGDHDYPMSVPVAGMIGTLPNPVIIRKFFKYKPTDMFTGLIPFVIPSDDVVSAAANSAMELKDNDTITTTDLKNGLSILLRIQLNQPVFKVTIDLYNSTGEKLGRIHMNPNKLTRYDLYLSLFGHNTTFEDDKYFTPTAGQYKIKMSYQLPQYINQETAKREEFEISFTVIDYTPASFGFLPFYTRPLNGTYGLTVDDTDVTDTETNANKSCFNITIPTQTSGCKIVNRFELATNYYDDTCKSAVSRFEYTSPDGKKANIPYSLIRSNIGGVDKVVAIEGTVVPSGEVLADGGKICIVWGQASEEVTNEKGEKETQKTSLKDTCRLMFMPLDKTTPNFAFISGIERKCGWCGASAQFEV